MQDTGIASMSNSMPSSMISSHSMALSFPSAGGYFYHHHHRHRHHHHHNISISITIAIFIMIFATQTGNGIAWPWTKGGFSEQRFVGQVKSSSLLWSTLHQHWRLHHHPDDQGGAAGQGLDGEAEGCEQGLKQARQGGGGDVWRAFLNFWWSLWCSTNFVLESGWSS